MPDLFETIEDVAAQRNAGADRAGQVLGMVFQGPAEGSNEVFLVLNARRSRLVDELTGAEIRVRRSSGAIRLMAFEVDSRVRCVPDRVVEARYGRPTDLAVPRPEQPPGSPYYLTFPQPWGELRIGTAQGCVVRVVAEFVEY